LSSLAVTKSRALVGLSAPEVTVEVHLANGLPSFTLVGLPEAEVKESRDRVRAALQHCKFEFPNRRITVNLAPADLPKEGGRFDLPVALAILAASGQIDATRLAEYEFAGELGLSGELRPVRGALAMALATQRAGKTLVLPEASAQEAALAQGAVVYAAQHLLDVAAHFSAATPTNDPDTSESTQHSLPSIRRTKTDTLHSNAVYPDLSEVKGQAQPKRALEIAAAGEHSLLLIGPPGTGKSMLAQRFAGLLPPMNDDEALESAAMLSLAGRFDVSRFRMRPYRAPHHSASAVALVGGSSNPRPGEISLAHHGVLFLDELPEFDRDVLEALREPLESGRITVSRAARQADFPARFQLIAAMNPCPCGYLGSKLQRCRCTPDQVSRYQGKISGPLLDRIDLQVEVPALPQHELLANPQASDSPAETTAQAAERTQRAHALATARQGKPNARLQGAEIDTHCALDDATRNFLGTAMTRLALSARATHRVLKVARTIADLAGSERITTAHIAEAIQLRRVLMVQ
jgi:magnesium chelatase family protein